MSIAGRNVLETFQFQCAYAIRPQGDIENGLNSDDGHIPYNQLSSVLNEAAAGFEHLYALGDSKCTLLSQLLGRPVQNLEGFNCPSPRYFIHKFSCAKLYHRNTSFRCATRHAHSLYEWLMYHLKKSLMLPAPMTRRIILPALSGIKRRGVLPSLIPRHDGITKTSYARATQGPMHLRRGRRSSL